MEVETHLDPAIAVSSAARDFDLVANAAWRKIQVLSGNAVATGLKIDPANVHVKGDHFSAVGSAFVRLGFEDNGETFWEGFSFPAYASGHIKQDGGVRFDSIRIDTDAFFK